MESALPFHIVLHLADLVIKEQLVLVHKVVKELKELMLAKEPPVVKVHKAVRDIKDLLV